MKRNYLKKVALLFCMTGTVFMMAGCSQIKKGSQTNLTEFYGLTSDEQYVVLVDGENSGKAYQEGEKLYLAYETVHNLINDKFYYDEEYNRILFATPDEVEIYEIGKDDNTKLMNNEIYIALDCIKERTEMNCRVLENPNRVAVSLAVGTVTVCRPNEDMVIRQFQRDGADYMAKVSKGESLVIKQKMDEAWYRVVKDDGITGYIKIEDTSGEESETRTAEFQAEEYSYLTMDETVCLGWHQVGGTAGNNSLKEAVSQGKDVLNVVSPTWFKLSDSEGNISSFAEASYIKEAHQLGLQVWALADDFSYGEDGKYYISAVLKDYDNRQNLIQNLVGEIKNCGADGLNIDFEKIYEEIADDYIQFIRELSIECHKNDIILSVDTYVPQGANEFYNRKGLSEAADYLVIMGYDEHWAGDNEAGSVASLPYVQKGIDDTIAVADAKRVINAIPFYTRIWTETPEGQTSEGTYVEDAVNGNYWLNSKAVGMQNAENELSRNGAELVWLEDLQQYYGEYQREDGSNVRVWLEEEKSIQAKLKVMAERGIGGVACWKLTLEKTEIWPVLQEYVKK